jgi:hypothetical protein
MMKSKRSFQIGVAGGVILLLLVVGFFLTGGWTLPVRQPISFNHRIHIENDLECNTCHQLYEEHASAGRPELETCLTCHEELITENPEEKKILEYAEMEVEIPWRRIYRLPEHIYFSHRRHVMSGKVECNVCHGNMSERKSPPTRPLVNQSMEWCIDCHKKTDADEDCLACHR